MTDPCVTEAMIEAGVHALMQYPDRQEIDIPAAVRDVLEAAMHSSRPVVERDCRECGRTGVAEYIEHFARPCDACGGKGIQHFTAMEAGLLDQCEAQASELVALKREVERLTAIVGIADELVNGDGLYTVAYADTPKLCVRERKDNSDPHARLCDALTQYKALTVSPEKPA